ncbi:MAG: hypothetical protein ACOZQL_11635 [Myxococcota bacterium]
MRLALALLALSLTLLACPQPPPAAPEPGPLLAGVATRRIDQPVGVPMGGYLRTKPASDPGSPWAQQFPASRGVQTEPTVRVLALTNGLTRVAFIRLDTTITSPRLRSRAIATLSAAGETARVFMYATHSHAAPARFMPPARLGSSTGTDFVSLVMDHYDPEVEARLTRAIADATAEAFAHLVPVSVGVATVDASDFNNDRRCENDPLYGHDFRDTTMTVIRFDEVGADGLPVRPLTALLHYAMHGTVLDSENTSFSTEAPGALELYASDALGVPALYVQGAAGDVSPRGSPFGHGEFQRLERQGRAAAELALEGWSRATPGAAPAKARLDFIERGVPISRAAIGYAEGEFPEGGGIQCAAGGPGDCGAVKSAPGDVVCLPLERRRASKTPLSLLRIGDDLLFLSLPGEPGTGLSRKIQAALAPLGASTTLNVGYAQDHFGYLLEEDDWLRGGYEPTVSPWGWKFGAYLLGHVQELVATIDQTQEAADVLTVTEPGAPRAATDSTRAPVITTEPQDAERLATHELVFEGGDPTLGTPQVSLEVKEGAAFVPVRASPTRVIVNGPELLLRYDAAPTFKAEPMATARTHLWQVKFETVPATPTGEYRLVARGQAQVQGATRSYELISRVFRVTKSSAVRGQLRLTMDGRLALSGRFPPNPTLFAQGLDDVIGNYRVRDLGASPADGARALGAPGSKVAATLTAPDQSTTAVMLSWSAAEGAWVSEPVTQSGSWKLDAAPGVLVDVDGNENGLAFSLSVTR